MMKKPKVTVTKRRLPAVRPRAQRRNGTPKHRALADGAMEVRDYIKALPSSQREAAERFDALVEGLVSDVDRVMKWKIPFYGVAGKGWFVSCMGRKSGVRVTFFQGVSLKPTPPLGGKQVRGIDLIHAEDVDTARMKSWIRQASKLPGFASQGPDARDDHAVKGGK